MPSTAEVLKNAHSNHSGSALVSPSSESAAKKTVLAAQWMVHSNDTAMPAASSHSGLG